VTSGLATREAPATERERIDDAAVLVRALGLSIITDQCLPDALAPVELERIIAVARGAEPVPADIVCGVLERL
jgi:hypothetical protein